MERKSTRSDKSKSELLKISSTKKRHTDEDNRWKCPFVGHTRLQGWQCKARLQAHLCIQHGMMTNADSPEDVNMTSLRPATLEEKTKYQNIWSRARAQRLRVSSLSTTSYVNTVIKTPGPHHVE